MRLPAWRTRPGAGLPRRWPDLLSRPSGRWASSTRRDHLARRSRWQAHPEDLVDEASNRVVGNRYRAGRSLSRAGPPELLEHARNAIDISRIANHGAEAVSLDRRGTARRRHDQRGDAHRHRFIELGGDLQLLVLREDHRQPRPGHHVERVGPGQLAQQLDILLDTRGRDGVVEYLSVA